MAITMHQRSQTLKIILGLLGAMAVTVPSAVFAQSRSDLPPVDPGVEDSVDEDAVDGDFDDRDRDPTRDPDVLDQPDATRPSSSTTARSERFFCQYSGSQYTVMYNPESRPQEAFPWAVPQAMGGGWTPELRCLEIARRLEEYRPDGLQELKTSTENGYNTVCVTSESNSRCRLVFTVPPGQDPLQTRDSVFENLTIADSGQQTQGVTTFADGGQTSIGNLGSGNGTIDGLVNLGLSVLSQQRNRRSNSAINLKPYLDYADGGTGVALNDGVPLTRTPRSSEGRRLQPNKFR